MDIPIVFACDDHYALPTAVAITSLIANKNAATSYDVRILTNALSGFHAQRLASLAVPGVSVTLMEIPDRHHDIPGHGHVTSTTLYRLALPELFPTHDSVLYLDGDIIILSDLSELLGLAHGQCYASVVQQVNICDLPPFAYHSRPKEFNAGILLLNLKRMRDENMYPRLIEAVVRNNIGANDQLALNQLFNEDVRWTDIIYNYASIYDFLLADKEAARHFNTSPAEWRRIRKHPVIIHYIDAKPWIARRCLHAAAWRRYFSLSPYRDVALPFRRSPRAFVIVLLNAVFPMFMRPLLRRFYVRFIK